MSDGFDDLPRLWSPSGDVHVLVHAHEVLHWDEDTAWSQLREAFAQDDSTAQALIELARAHGCTSTDGDEVARHVARLIATGTLTAIERPQRPTGLRPLWPGAAPPPSWDDLRPLSDLVERPTSWVSIEVVDHAGVPHADLELVLVHADGRRDAVVLDALGRCRAEGLSDRGTTSIVWPERIERKFGAPLPLALDGFVRVAGDLTIARAPKGARQQLPGIDRHHRIVVLPPTMHATVSYPSSMFASGSALPTCAISDLVTRAQELADPDPSVRLGIFGHTDSEGGPLANKQLAERRAQATFGVLTGDWDTFRAAIARETLPVTAYQMMLRVLGCNPTAIDGELGDQTRVAVASFRRAYNADAWHDEGRARAYGDLSEGDALDSATKDAIVDAYHAESSGELDAARFLGPRHMGCGELNPLGDAKADHRRVTLTVYGADAPEASEFPCVRGEPDMCQRDGAKGSSFRCKFYRERIGEAHVEHELTPFWDFDWMRTVTGKTHLSALTHLPDCDDAKFVVRVVEGGRQPDDDQGRGSAPVLGDAVAQLPGLVRAGVAYALWDHGEGYDPLDQQQWFRRPGETDADHLWLAAYRPPVFSVESAGLWGFSSGPGVGMSRVAEKLDGQARAAAVLADGRIVLVDRGAVGMHSPVRVTAAVIPGMTTKHL